MNYETDATDANAEYACYKMRFDYARQRRQYKRMERAMACLILSLLVIAAAFFVWSVTMVVHL